MADCEEGDYVCEDSEWGHGDLAWQHEYAVSGAVGRLSHGQPPDLLLRRKDAFSAEPPGRLSGGGLRLGSRLFSTQQITTSPGTGNGCL